MGIRSCILPALVAVFSWSTGWAQEGSDFDAWLKKDQQSLQEFKDKRDRQFLEFLQRDWQEYQAFQGLVRDQVPKPLTLPVVEPQAPAPPLESKIVEIPSPPVISPSLPAPPPAPLQHPVYFVFYGDSLAVSCDQDMILPLDQPLGKGSIRAFWEGMSRSAYEECLAQAQQLGQRLGLNDWGYGQLLGRIGQSLYPGDGDRVRLFVWFMLAKSGYAAQVGYDAQRIYLLVPTLQTLYGNTYLTLGDQKYYSLSFEDQPEPIETVYTYEGNYPEADRRIDLSLTAPPRLGGGIEEKVLEFRYGSQDLQVKVSLERLALGFLRSYPQTEYAVYFASAPSTSARSSLIQGLKPLISGRSEVEAVDILLRLVQLGFGYQVDQEQFGRERSLFADETLFYPASDCEDRAILFAYLVRELLGLEVIGLDYPGHIAAAVRFSSPVPGDAVVVGGQSYTICDPTYLNATAGMAMPNFKGVEPKIIQIRG